MAQKLLLGVLSAGMVLALAAPAFAQNDRNRGDNRDRESAYSQTDDRRGAAARNDQRGGDRNVRGNDRRSDGRRGVKRQVFQTRFRARIVLTEQRVRTRRGPKRVCTVSARGPQARLVPKKRLRRIARNNCSKRAKIQISTFRGRR